jgi:hypothetical protein
MLLKASSERLDLQPSWPRQERDLVYGKLACQRVGSSVLKADIKAGMAWRSKNRTLGSRVETWLDTNAQLVSTEKQQGKGVIWSGGNSPQQKGQLCWVRANRASYLCGKEIGVCRRVGNVEHTSLPDEVPGFTLEGEVGGNRSS